MSEKIMEMSLEEIQSRIAEIDVEVRDLTDAEEITKRTEELRELAVRKHELEAVEQREAEAQAIEEGTIETTTVEKREEPTIMAQTYNAGSPEYRSAWLKNVAVDADGRHFLGEMDVEERAAFTFLTSNTGAVVPTEVQNRIVDLVKAEAPMVEDSIRTAVEGVFAFPQRTAIAQGDAAVVAEGSANGNDEQDTIKLVTLAGVDIKKHAIMSRRMKFQSIDAFEDWLVADIAKRIAVAEEAVVLNRLSGVTPGAGESVNSDVKIDSGNVLASQAYSDAVIRTIMSKIDENGQVVIYANATTIWTGLAGIVDADNNKIMIPNSQMDPVSQGRIYGAIVKKDSNIADNVAYFGVQGALKTNSFGGIEVFATQEAKTANMIYTGAEIFDAGLENPKAFVKVTFTVGE